MNHKMDKGFCEQLCHCYRARLHCSLMLDKQLPFVEFPCSHQDHFHITPHAQNTTCSYSRSNKMQHHEICYENISSSPLSPPKGGWKVSIKVHQLKMNVVHRTRTRSSIQSHSPWGGNKGGAIVITPTAVQLTITKQQPQKRILSTFRTRNPPFTFKKLL